MWIFGYGSLIWKADFPFCSKLVGHIKGYRRVFWQGSVDHRGIPEKPGRVVTLIKSSNENEEVWGVAYEIPAPKVADVISQLDIREKDGYDQHTVQFYPNEEGRNSFELLIYLANENNPYFLGPATTDSIANQIFHAVGPSGRNLDYLLNLAESMRNLCPHISDPHLNELELAVKQISEKKLNDSNSNIM